MNHFRKSDQGRNLILFRSLVMALGLVTVAPAFAIEENSTDQALLEDLGADLLKPSDDALPDERSTALDQSLLDQLGEDLGEQQNVKDDWLTRVIDHMKTAEKRLAVSAERTPASAAQAEALTGLDAMIAELTQRKSQCQGGNCNKPGEPKPGQKPKPNGKTGQNPAQTAPSSTNSDADLSTDLAAAGELVKDLWGKLPERQRQQILQPLSEEFLPKYASEIEAYFRALAQPTASSAESQ